MATHHNHKVRQLERHAPKHNKLVLGKQNIETLSIAGKDGYGVGKNQMVFEIRNAAALVPNTLKLKGVLKIGAGKAAQLCGAGVYSLVEQIQIEYNGQSVLRLNNNAQYVASVNSLMKLSAEEYDMDTVTALRGEELQASTSYPFLIDLTRFGLDIESFLPTASSPLSIRITLGQTAKAFYGSSVAAEQFTYAMDGVVLTGDYFQLSGEAVSMIEKAMTSATGSMYIFQAPITQQSNILPSNTQDITVSMPYRNVVKTVHLPIPGSFNPNASGISTVDVINTIVFNQGNQEYATNYLAGFIGANYVNLNGTVGESANVEHYVAAMKAARKSPYDKSYLSGFTTLFKGGSYQPLVANFLKDEYDDVKVVQSGVNGINSSGNLNLKFNLSAAPEAGAKQLLTIGYVTTVMEVKNGVSSVTQ